MTGRISASREGKITGLHRQVTADHGACDACANPTKCPAGLYDGGRIIWLNPLKGWRDYAPVAGGMAAALPHPDLVAPPNTLGAPAALEPELGIL